MIPSLARKKSNHKSEKIDGISTLVTSVVYGANASGKSNLVKAIAFGQSMILYGTSAMAGYEPFRLDVSTQNATSSVEFEFQSNGKNYAYGFDFNRKGILEEWLYLLKRNSQTKIYNRKLINGKVNLDYEYLIKLNPDIEQQQFISYLFKSTPDNELFLHSLINGKKTDGNVDNFNDINNAIHWFKYTLTVLFPNQAYREGVKSQVGNNELLHNIYETILKYFDTGISKINLRDIDQSEINVPKQIIERIKENFSKDSRENCLGMISGNQDTYFISKDKNKEIIFQEFTTGHAVKGQNNLEFFKAIDESDGTNRLIDLIPLIIDLIRGNKVFVVDEMERSLHPNIMYAIFDAFLSTPDLSKNKSQLIVTTHESVLLTSKLLRKDEIWFAVKSKDGTSRLLSLQDYTDKFDDNVRRDYLLGRYRGVPRIGDKDELIDNITKNTDAKRV